MASVLKKSLEALHLFVRSANLVECPDVSVFSTSVLGMSGLQCTLLLHLMQSTLMSVTAAPPDLASATTILLFCLQL